MGLNLKGLYGSMDNNNIHYYIKIYNLKIIRILRNISNEGKEYMLYIIEEKKEEKEK